jgi:hypothetical protein
MLAPGTSSDSKVSVFRWTLWQSIKHQAYDFLALIRMRDRLRCPKCAAVGTWKPHGGWLESIDPAHRKMLAMLPSFTKRAYNRRWLCKYCGYNLSTEGEFQCYPNARLKVWALKDQHSTPTPKERVGDDVWPWRG